MTGSVQEKKGYLYTVIRMADGSYKWQSTGLKTKGNKKAAERLLRERINELEQSEGLIDYRDILFTDFMLEWLDVAKTQIRPHTHHAYTLLVKNSIIPYFGRMKLLLRELQPMHLQKYYAYRMNHDGVCANTVKRVHVNIHKALKYALRCNLILYNPADRVELPKVEEYVGNFYTQEEIRRIFEVIKGHEFETPVLLAATYGLRRSEAIGLKWDAVDFDQKRLTIKHTVVGSGKNQVIMDTTKTKSSNRSLYLIPPIEEHLLAVKAKQQEYRELFGNCYIESDYICTRADGSLLNPDRLSHQFPQLMEQHGLPRYRFHDLRHSSASLLLANGCSLKEIGSWLGHSSIATTNRYAHLMFQSTIDMANSVQSSLFE